MLPGGGDAISPNLTRARPRQVVDLTTEMSLQEEELSKDRQRLTMLERPHSRRSLGAAPARLGEYEELRERVATHEASRASLQVLIACPTTRSFERINPAPTAIPCPCLHRTCHPRPPLAKSVICES
jgi:hypothetical protein